MNRPKILHNLTMIPFYVIGFIALMMGSAWLFSSEPWLLDKSANFILLEKTYEELFENPINKNLPKYLFLLYRFFGWWLTMIGMLTLAYTYITRMGTFLSRSIIHFIYFISLIGIAYLQNIFIPSSHFVYLSYFFWLLWMVSVYSSIQLKKYDN